MERADAVRWRCTTTLRQYDADIDEYRRRYGRSEGERLFGLRERPVAERVVTGNLLLQEGIVALFTLLTGGAEAAFSAANARIGVGDSNTPAADTQTGLQGTNVAFMGMDAGYPVVGAAADKSVTFRATFGPSDANWAWEEWTVDNGATAGRNLNRKVESLGTKSGGSWQLTVTISLA